MASFETLKNGHIRVCVFVNGIRESKTLATASKAKSWAKEREAEPMGRHWRWQAHGG